MTQSYLLIKPRPALLALAVAATTVALAGGAAWRWTPSAIASDQYESSPAFSPDGRTLYFMRANRQFSAYRLMQSTCGAAGWTAATEVPFAAAQGVSEADPHVSPDGRQLYFVSARPFAGKVGDDLDIWVADSDGHGGWSAPRRLPEPVNSPHAELMPRVGANGRIHFGSDRPGGLGGNDVYVATPLRGGGFRVDNLGSPLNTAKNDYEIEVSRDGLTAVVVSDREGRSHLYRYTSADGPWRLVDRIEARPDVFQVGPLLSPKADRLLFAQTDGERSGEIFLADLAPTVDATWPPTCPAGTVQR
jgi:Tol biopolymer transport system component